MYRNALALAAVLLATTPLATADHGLEGTLVGALADGPVQAQFTYVTGLGNAQTWDFTWFSASGSFRCYGYGSSEVGFVSTPGCPVAWSTGAAGDQHAYPYARHDVHQVSVTVGGASGTAAWLMCADTGRLAAECQETVASLEL